MNQTAPVQTPTGYADSFSVGFGPGDVEITFMLRGQPMMRMILPHTTGKELQRGLGETIERFERASGQKITPLNDVNEMLATNMPQGGPQRGGKIIM